MQFASNKICARGGFEPQAHKAVRPIKCSRVRTNLSQIGHILKLKIIKYN